MEWVEKKFQNEKIQIVTVKNLLKISFQKEKKLKKLLKKDVKPRQHCLNLEVLKKGGYADGNDPGWIERN